jgi:hypothetical protein
MDGYFLFAVFASLSVSVSASLSLSLSVSLSLSHALTVSFSLVHLICRTYSAVLPFWDSNNSQDVLEAETASCAFSLVETSPTCMAETQGLTFPHFREVDKWLTAV